MRRIVVARSRWCSWHAGELDASCNVTTGGVNGRAVCTGIMALAGGPPSLAALAPMSDGNAPVRIAIVGGTGVYEGATGSMVSKSRGKDSPYSEDTIHLVLR